MKVLLWKSLRVHYHLNHCYCVYHLSSHLVILNMILEVIYWVNRHLHLPMLGVAPPPIHTSFCTILVFLRKALRLSLEVVNDLQAVELNVPRPLNKRPKTPIGVVHHFLCSPYPPGTIFEVSMPKTQREEVVNRKNEEVKRLGGFCRTNIRDYRDRYRDAIHSIRYHRRQLGADEVFGHRPRWRPFPNLWSLKYLFHPYFYGRHRRCYCLRRPPYSWVPMSFYFPFSIVVLRSRTKSKLGSRSFWLLLLT